MRARVLAAEKNMVHTAPCDPWSGNVRTDLYTASSASVEKDALQQFFNAEHAVRSSD